MTRVLIVDDDKFARIGLRSIIPWEEYGMEVVGEAANGKRALEFMRSVPVDLVFADIAMPILDGIGLIEQAQREFPDVRFVVLSFHEDFEYLQKALRLGVLDYISKEKMELENYREVMLRIKNRLQEEQADSARDAQQLEECLAGVLWLYDNTQMDLVCGELDRAELSLRTLERKISAVIARIVSDTGVELGEVPQLHDVESAKRFLLDCRALYIRRVQAQNDSVYARLMLAAQYVWENSAAQFTANDAASRIGYSRSYFSISFKKVLGVTFNAFLRRERIRSAKKLLRETKLPQGEISRRVGYEDVKNFKTVFGELAGCSPVEYRAKCSQNTEHLPDSSTIV